MHRTSHPAKCVLKMAGLACESGRCRGEGARERDAPVASPCRGALGSDHGYRPAEHHPCPGLLDERTPLGEAASLAAAETIASDEPAASVAKLDGRMEATATEAQAGPRPGDPSALSVFEVAPPLRSIDGTSFRDGERIVRLAVVEAPRATDVCINGEVRWSCGLQARAALHNTVANRRLSC